MVFCGDPLINIASSKILATAKIVEGETSFSLFLIFSQIIN
jgi:hypothetical protein